MARLNIEDIRSQKNYYPRGLKRLSKALMGSFIFMGVLIFAIFIVFIKERPTDYYATTSASQIVALKPLNQPNYSAQPLLPPDPPEEFSANKSLGDIENLRAEVPAPAPGAPQ